MVAGRFFATRMASMRSATVCGAAGSAGTSAAWHQAVKTAVSARSARTVLGAKAPWASLA
jgi:hypothetical protein